MIDVIAFQGDQIIRPSEVDTPVGIAIAGGRIACNAIEVIIRYSDPI